MFTYALIDTISKDYIQHIKKKNNIKSFIETYITYNSFNNTFMKERGKAVKSYLKKEDINKTIITCIKIAEKFSHGNTSQDLIID